jgi:hypothetical protein
MRQSKKSSPFQCNNCQEVFQTQEDLQNHEVSVDCPTRCFICRKETRTKAQRIEHQTNDHPETQDDPILMEIDESKWKIIKDRLKIYTESIKKGKSRVDPELTQWVQANTVKYEIGRTSDPKANSKLELGQWYIIFKTIAKEMKILEHPCKDRFDSEASCC